MSQPARAQQDREGGMAELEEQTKDSQVWGQSWADSTGHANQMDRPARSAFVPLSFLTCKARI